MNYYFRPSTMASYYRALRQYPGAAHHQISLNFLLRHCCYFISQIYFHIGKAFEDGGGKEPQSESSCSVGALSFFFPVPWWEPRASANSALWGPYGRILGQDIQYSLLKLTWSQNKGQKPLCFQPTRFQVSFSTKFKYIWAPKKVIHNAGK